ncbi:hypothetical protein MSIMFB_00829 [Mycobacterium simulans]|uniref:Uncharacterized protein n=1 Tax=Mycobacterium simulans TaxID=627089 RepID=A0A7Z7IH64_9MYCO|nr:hypothetical protein MSIMFB_00829 [Mycobacterium simulans]
MAIETSSWAADSRPVVWAAAAALADSSVAPILAKSEAAVANTSGTVLTNDIFGPLYESWFDRQTAVDLVSFGEMGVIAGPAVDCLGSGRYDAGRMFWLMWNTLRGSYSALISLSRR